MRSARADIPMRGISMQVGVCCERREAAMGELTILFLGATGRFAPLARLLLDRGHRVLAGTRDPAGPAARRLRGRGAGIVTAHFDDTSGLHSPARPAHALAAAGNPPA